MRQSHGDRNITVRPPCDVSSVFGSVCVSVSCCILFYLFQVPSQLKRGVLHVWYTNAQNIRQSYSHHAISARPPYESRPGTVRFSMHGCGDCTMTDLCTISARSLCGFTPVRCRNLSKSNDCPLERKQKRRSP